MTRLVAKLEPLTLNSLPEPRLADAAVDFDFDRRWRDWLAAGHRHDVRMRRRMGRVAWVIGAALVLWSAWSLVPSVAP